MVLQNIRNNILQAFRVYVRQRTRPLSVEEAEEKRLFWSKCYVSFGFLLFSYATYMTYKKNYNFNYDPNVPKEEAVIRKLYGHTKDKVVVYRPLKGTHTEYDLRELHKEEEKEQVVKESS